MGWLRSGLSSDSVSAETRIPSSPAADHYQVMIHVDETALSHNEGQSDLPIETVKRLCCDSSVVAVVENEAGNPLNVGRKQRTVPTTIRRALWARDRGCAFPGCSDTRFVDAHHIQHWSNGGETSIENCCLLCSRHHKSVHEGGYSVSRSMAGELVFKRADGRVIPASGYRLVDWRDVHVGVGEPVGLYLVT